MVEVSDEVARLREVLLLGVVRVSLEAIEGVRGAACANRARMVVACIGGAVIAINVTATAASIEAAFGAAFYFWGIQKTTEEVLVKGEATAKAYLGVNISSGHIGGARAALLRL